MRLSTLLSAAIASSVVVNATLQDDLQAYIANHPGEQAINDQAPEFIDWKEKDDPIGRLKAPAPAPVLPNAYYVQLKPGTDLTKRGLEEHTQFHKRAADIDYSTRYEFKDPSLFFGLSIQVKDDTNETVLAELPDVVKVWPIRLFPRPLAAVDSQFPRTKSHVKREVTPSYVVTAGSGADLNALHRATGVDRLHQAGIKGKGIKIGIADTGVDWRHPALGAGFGPGHRISFGRDLVGDDYDSTGVPVEDDDPLATCVSGAHGTHVTGTIGAIDGANSSFGLIGVAPEAEIGMYRIFGCTSEAAFDVILRAFELAAADKVDILSLSIGAGQQYEIYDYFAEATAALEAKGIAVIAANGNDATSPGITSTPAIGHKVIGVGSTQNSHFPTVYVGKDSRGRSFKYPGSPWPVTAPTTGLKVYDFAAVAANQTSPVGCNIASLEYVSNQIEDKDNSILVVPAGGCRWGYKISGNQYYGFKYVLVYDVPGADVFDSDYNTFEPSHPYYGITVNEVDGQTILGGLRASGEDYRLFFNSNVFESKSQHTSGLISNFSSTGPTSDQLSLKPQLSAPGQNILSTWPLEGSGYAIISGTSMATPYVSGAYALLKSQFPTASVQKLREILQSTARTVPYAYDNGIRASAAQQGSGLINVYNAIHFESGVSPSELDLGDLDALKPQEITIENRSTRSKTYVISHDPAGLINLQPNNYELAFTEMVAPARGGQYKSYAAVTFSATSIKIPGGSSAKFTVTFTPPQDQPISYHPIYSGHIKITNNNDEFVVPYLGQQYSRYDAQRIDNSNKTGIQLPSFIVSSGTAPLTDIIEVDFGLSNPGVGWPAMWLFIMQIYGNCTVELVPYNTTFVPTHYGFEKTESNPNGVPESALPLKDPGLPIFNRLGADIYGVWWEESQIFRNVLWLVILQPSLREGVDGLSTLLTTGDYRALVRVQKWGGDVNNPESYESWLSGVIRIQR